MDHERGIPSKCSSSGCTDYVPALCTHRPSLLPSEWSGKILELGWIYLIGENYQTYPLRGRRSRNKVSVDESAEGSLT